MHNNTEEKKTRKRRRMGEYVGTREAAEMLGFHQMWVEKLCRSGKIEAAKPVREWRIKRSVVERMLEGKGGSE